MKFDIWSYMLDLGVLREEQDPRRVEGFRDRELHIYEQLSHGQRKCCPFLKNEQRSAAILLGAEGSGRRHGGLGMEAKHRETIALDETIIKVNGRPFYLYAALDVERNELVWMRVYAARNYHFYAGLR
jgi:hypothetical protein